MEDGRQPLEINPGDREKELAVQDELEQLSTPCVISQAVWIVYCSPQGKYRGDTEIYLSSFKRKNELKQETDGKM